MTNMRVPVKSAAKKKDVDARHKAGHDGGEAVPSPIVMPALVAGIHVFAFCKAVSRGCPA
jgi:ribosomal protein L11